MTTRTLSGRNVDHEIAFEIERLLQELLHRRREDAGAPLGGHAGWDETAAEIVLELQVDGVPYRLIRAVPGDPPADGEPHRASLSPREREIVRLVARGLPNKSIAQVLDISLWTVATHLRRIFAKLNVGTRAEMIARIHEDGLLHSDSPTVWHPETHRRPCGQSRSAV